MKPMLATDAKEIKFPVYASPKLDGIRCVIKDSEAVSRTLKRLPNKHIQKVLGLSRYEGLDGEIVVGDRSAQDAMQKTTSGVMSYEGQPDFTYWVFDWWTNTSLPYEERYKTLGCTFETYPNYRHDKHVKLLKHTLIETQEQLDQFEKECLMVGYEGVMIRSLDGPYKYGRSTARQGYLLKVKRFADSEAVILGTVERMHNANEATIGATGHTERSTHKDNMVPMNTLGSIVVKDCETEIEFSVGTGFDDALRQQLWDSKDSLVGKIIKYKHFANAGVKEKPRFPVFLGFRDQIDMGEL